MSKSKSPEKRPFDVETGYLSIGSNLGERESQILRAVGKLDALSGVTIAAVSPLFETEPVECPPQPFFINMVVEVNTLLSSRDLLKRIQAIEADMGRTGSRNEPRRLDIDIISLGDTVVNEEDLVIPHPRYHKRSFVLTPMREIAPSFRCPVRGMSVEEMLAGLSGRDRVDLVSSRKLIYS